MGSGEGWAPKTADFAPLHACKSASSSPSHACVQCETLPLVEELTIPSGLEASAALPYCCPLCRTVPSSGEVAPPPSSCKSAATLASFLGVCKTSPIVQDFECPAYCKREASTSLPVFSHELVYVSEVDDIVISQIIPKLWSRDSLTVLCPKSAGDNSFSGLHIVQRCDILVAAPLLEKLGAGVQNPAHFHPNFVVPFVTCCMLSLSPAIEKHPPLSHSSNLLPHLSCSAGVDFSSTCIEFRGSVHGRECRVLLDSGATANFVSEIFSAELTLPPVLLSPPVVVNMADGRASVTTHSVSLDLTVGSL